MKVSVEEGVVTLERADESKSSKSLHGLYRALINNMVEGVSKGFTKELQLVGVGYRASNQGQRLELALGFSHNIVMVVQCNGDGVGFWRGTFAVGCFRDYTRESGSTRRLQPETCSLGNGKAAARAEWEVGTPCFSHEGEGSERRYRNERHRFCACFVTKFLFQRRGCGEVARYMENQT